MDPVTLFMIAQAGASIGGQIFNMGANINNYQEQLRRMDKQRTEQMTQLSVAENRVGENSNLALGQIGMAMQGEAVANTVAGRESFTSGPSTAVNQAVSREMLQSTRALQDINLQRQQTIDSFNQASQDLGVQHGAQQAGGIFSIAGTALGAAANIGSRMANLADPAKAVAKAATTTPTGPAPYPDFSLPQEGTTNMDLLTSYKPGPSTQSPLNTELGFSTEMAPLNPFISQLDSSLKWDLNTSLDEKMFRQSGRYY